MFDHRWAQMNTDFERTKGTGHELHEFVRSFNHGFHGADDRQQREIREQNIQIPVRVVGVVGG
jgi:hypothetical protein